MKILSIDGGGIRGIIPAMVLAHIEEKTGKSIAESFDLIAGTSTGGILALGLAVDNGKGQAKYSATDLVKLYRERGKDIFSKSIFNGSFSSNLRHKILEGEHYDCHKYRDILSTYFGHARLSQALTEVIIPSYEMERRDPWIFKSMHAKNPNKKHMDFTMLDVAMATSAAPTYFEPHRIPYRDNSYLCMIDGGIYANNPAMCAYAEAKSLFKQKDEDIFMLSLGTGQPTNSYYYEEVKDYYLSFRWLKPLIDCVSDGVNDTTDYQLSKILDAHRYFRLQAILAKDNEDMDNADEKNLRALQVLAEELIHDKQKQLDKIIHQLTE